MIDWPWRQRTPLCVLTVFVAALSAGDRTLASPTVRGVVFDDRNTNAVRDANEPGLPGVCVSNGRDVVKTDAEGRYSLPIDDDDIVFVIKPRDWIPPVDALNHSRFYYVHKPAGSPKPLKHAGVSPTGPLPTSVDFPLIRHAEPEKFRVVALGDPQSGNVTDLNYLARDIVAELIGVDAAFGVSLGDVVFDDLSLYAPHNALVGKIGIPWFNLPGNHDMNYDVKSDELADETWERVFGPTTYSFDWGGVHFIILDDVMYDGHIKRGKYHGELGRHLTFIENDLRHVPDEKLVVLMMHIPVIEVDDRAKLFALLQDRTHTFSISGHWHIQRHFFLGSEDGWKGSKPHHHLVNVTACGTWWQGAPDEYGIPHTMMRDGAPNGYSVLTFEGNDYSIRFKAARRPADDQMSIFLQDSVSRSDLGETEVVVNVFAGSSKSTVKMRVGDRTPWKPLVQVERLDPYYAALFLSQIGKTLPKGQRLRAGVNSPHIWTANLPGDLPVGTHVVHIQTRDMFGQIAHGRRVIRVR